jgi:Domain of unknown function (DUF1963)
MDRYEDLMTRREALSDECWRRMQAVRDRVHLEAPLVPVSWRSEGIVLHPDGRLIVDVEESDGHHRQRRYTLWSELDGTIREMPAPAGAAETVAFSPDPRLVAGSPEPGKGQLSRLARRHLGQAAAGAWLRLLCPAVRLARAEPGDPVVAQLGGLPALPINSWPVWPGTGPLSHVLTVDCPSLAALMPGWEMPDSGRLAFFYFDGLSYVRREGSDVGSWDPATQEGARVLWLHPEESTPAGLTHVATPAPPGLTPFPAVALTAVPVLTWPDAYDPRLRRIWDIAGLAQPPSEWALPPAVESFYEALHDMRDARPGHQVGGHPDPVQLGDSVQLEAEQIERAVRGAGDPADGWRLLAQVDSDDAAKMMWGDVGKLYFMIRPDDLQARRFDHARFTWQCS